MNQLKTISLRSRRRHLKYYVFLIFIAIILVVQLFKFLMFEISKHIENLTFEPIGHWFDKLTFGLLASLGIYSLFVILIALMDGGDYEEL